MTMIKQIKILNHQTQQTTGEKGSSEINLWSKRVFFTGCKKQNETI